MATRAMRAEIRSKFECTRAQDFPFFYGISQPFKDVDSSGQETRAEQSHNYAPRHQVPKIEKRVALQSAVVTSSVVLASKVSEMSC